MSNSRELGEFERLSLFLFEFLRTETFQRWLPTANHCLTASLNFKACQLRGQSDSSQAIK